MKTTVTDAIARRRAAHHAALLTLAGSGPKVPTDGLKLWRALRKIECRANAAATAQCNGEAFGGQPFRGEREWETFCIRVRADVAKAFGGRPPEGFFFNSDPRGYALKVEPEKMPSFGNKLPEGLQFDWGHYGLLAAEINQ